MSELSERLREIALHIQNDTGDEAAARTIMEAAAALDAMGAERDELKQRAIDWAVAKARLHSPVSASRWKNDTPDAAQAVDLMNGLARAHAETLLAEKAAEAAEAESERLTELLGKYGGHDGGCCSPAGPCGCGWDTARD